MAFESLLALIQPPLVHAKPDVARANPDGRKQRETTDRKSRAKRESSTETASPVPNSQGQLTGKLIDTTA